MSHRKRYRIKPSEADITAQCMDCLFTCPRANIVEYETKERTLAYYDKIFCLYQVCAKCPECKSFGISTDESRVHKKLIDGVSLAHNVVLH